MGRRGQGPQISCPGCPRQVRVGPNSERIIPHKNPNTNNRCASSSQHIDVYGTGPTNPNGGAQ